MKLIQKNNLFIALTILISSIIMCSCSDTTEKKPEETTVVTSDIVSQPQIDSTMYEQQKICMEFLKSLTTYYNNEHVDNTNILSLLKGVEFKSITPVLNSEKTQALNENTNQKGLYYNVEIDVIQSDVDEFKSGKSQWVLIYNPSNQNKLIFVPEDYDTHRLITLAQLNDNPVNLCVHFSTEYNIFDNLENTQSLFPEDADKKKKNNLYIMTARFSSCVTMPSADEYNNTVRKYLGLFDFDFYNYFDFNDEKELPEVEFKVLKWTCPYLVSDEYNAEANERTIVIDYYGDESCIFKAKTLKYTLHDDSNGNYYIKNVSLVSDRGFNAIYGTN